MGDEPPILELNQSRESVIRGVKEHYSYAELSTLVYSTGSPRKLYIRTAVGTLVTLEGTEDNLIEVTINSANPLGRMKIRLELAEFK